MQPFTIKYAPKSIKQIVAQPTSKVKSYVDFYKSQKKKAILLYGPPGNGKTATAIALAKDLELETVEINASDVRNADQINALIGSAIGQQSLFSKGKLILIDEIDGLSGTKDRGGLPAIIKLIEKSTFPVILTATNPWANKFSGLRRKVELIEYSPLEYTAIYDILKNICQKEKIKFEDEVLKGLARRAGNDARAAINDLQTLSMESKDLTKKSLEELGERNKLDTMLNALVKIFKSTDPNVAISAFDMVQEDLNEQFLWLDENLPKEYKKPKDLASAYDKLSKADVFNRRIRRWQHWRFLIYINALITAGIATSKKEKNKEFIQYKPTGRILKLWWAKQKTMKKKAIAEKLAEKTHSSKKTALHNLPILQQAFKNNKEFEKNFTNELDLSKEEVLWLKK